jgi:predicted tellurium resistance membrane protein TerC
VSVPVWAWVAFVAFVVAMLALDLFVLHRRAQEVSLKEAARWTAVWLAIGLGFGGLLWAWEGESTAQAYLAGYLIEKSLSLDNVFVFAVIFATFAIPARYQHRVLMLGIKSWPSPPTRSWSTRPTCSPCWACECCTSCWPGRRPGSATYGPGWRSSWPRSRSSC